MNQTHALITELDQRLESLASAPRELVSRIYHTCSTTGEVLPPESMHSWIAEHFGSVDAVRRQRIVKVTNLVTLEGALFNELRASRPIESTSQNQDLADMLQATNGGPFCQPREGTPEDVFGRVESAHAITASNIAKYDGWHGLVIFEEHNPLCFNAQQVMDYVDLAQVWLREAHATTPEACYPFFLWNCLWRSGASILHGHAQVTLTQGMHYGRVELWRRAAADYAEQHGSNYFSDLILAHRALDLVIDHGQAAILPSLTPIKDKETTIIASHWNRDLTSALYHVLDTMITDMGVQSFNVALYQPPLIPTREDWTGFPYVFRIVDRGPLDARTSDMGAMEFFAQSVVATDPYDVAGMLSQRVPKKPT